MGVDVTVIEFLDRICPGTDLEVAKAFQKILQKQGIKFIMSTKVLAGKNLGNSTELTYEPVKGGDQVTINQDIILIATGRRPYTEKLNCDKAGI
jgi:dihydrolipoamide dehydrogenase